MSMPSQKPGRSKQDYQTPSNFLTAIKKRLGIRDFVIDVAASKSNAVAKAYYDIERSGLGSHNRWYLTQGGWAWCNPPYENIEDWVAKACEEALQGAQVCMLVPASVGANWWKKYVENYAFTLFLNGRITFVGASDPYPKDCAVLLYVPWRATGNQVWSWQDAL